MTVLALQFTTPALLIGLVAAAIPVALHLLAAARAREASFPTLRFLRRSMQRTARRRRVRNWLLLILRSLLLGLLAFAVAEPYSQTSAQAPTGPAPYAAVILIDNSLSMTAAVDPNRPAGPTLFDRAKAQAGELLSDEHPPDQAAVMTTNAPPRSGAADEPQRLRRDPTELRGRLAAMDAPAGGPDRLASRLRRAAELLRRAEQDRRVIYLFTDAQASAYGALDRIAALSGAGDIRLAVVRPVAQTPPNVAAGDLSVTGPGVLGRPLRIAATLRNFSPTDARVTAAVTVGDEPVGPSRTVRLAAAGDEGDRQSVEFDYVPRTVGAVEGRLLVRPAGAETADALAIDNDLPFRIEIRDRARVLVVHGPTGRDEPPGYAPSDALQTALSPFDDPTQPWPVALRPADGVPASTFSPDQLGGMHAVFFADVPAFSPDQAEAVAAFARDGGRVALFLGPYVDVENYNQRLGVDGADLLPGTLHAAVGQLGGGRDGSVLSRRPDGTHPLLAGLYEDASRYPRVAVMRYYPIELHRANVTVPLRHARSRVDDAGDPLVTVAPFRRGRVMLCATSASPVWNNLSAQHIFLPMVVRMAIGATSEPLPTAMCAAGATAVLPLPEDIPGEVRVTVTPPKGADITAQVRDGRAVLTDTWRLGRYTWTATTPSGTRVAAGALFVHAPWDESDLRPADATELTAKLRDAGLQSAHVGAELPDWTTAEADAGPAPQRQRRWWDLVLVGVIGLLVVESVVANRLRRQTASHPATPS
ncbi:MAG: vWA domain-containing protein [Planctomycetota bacterium]